MTERFSELLPVEALGDDRFVVRPPGSGFLFGGLSMAVLLRCAAETAAPEQAPMSLQATFLANGDWGGPHEVTVRRVSNSRTFAVRRIEMTTNGRLAIIAEAVFHQPEAGDDWQAGGPPDAPAPEALEPYRADRLPLRLIEVRAVAATAAEPDRIHPYWSRTLERLDDPVLRACALAFISDFWVFATPFPTGSGGGEGLLSRTFTHALTFHRPPADGWWYFDCDPLTVSGGRFLSRGEVHAPDGALLASFVQQGVIRPQR